MDNIPQTEPAEIRVRAVPGPIKARLVIAAKLNGQSEGDYVIDLLDRELPVYEIQRGATNANT